MSRSSPTQFNYGATLLMGLGFFGISMIWPVLNTYLPLFLQAGRPDFAAAVTLPDFGFALPPTLVALVMTSDNILNVFIQPWAGAKSDRTWNRFGRRKPWMLVGVPLAFIGFTLIPVAAMAGSLLAIMGVILLTNLGMAIFRSPTVAWLGDLFPAEQRSRANGAINLMGGIGAAIALFGGGWLYDRYGPTAPFIATSLVLVVAILVVVVKIEEPAHIDLPADDGNTLRDNLRAVWHTHNRSGVRVLLAVLFMWLGYEALQFGLSSFVVLELGLTPGAASRYITLFAAAFLAFAIPSGLLGSRFGRRQTMLFGTATMFVVFSAGWLLVRDPISLVVALALGGMGWSLTSVNGLPLVYDYGDEGRIGAYTGMYFFASQSAAIGGPLLAGMVIDIFGDDYRIVWGFAALAMAVALVMLWGLLPVTNSNQQQPQTGGS